MNLREASGKLRTLFFRTLHAMLRALPHSRIMAFGSGRDKISSIMVINLDRQPDRWRLVCRELSRFRTSNGTPLLSITRRFCAVDARDGRAVAPTADVDTIYRVGDQLFVQPDARLEACFGADEPVSMTRQEVAVARSHVEVWKAVAAGSEQNVLVLEDDVWFRPFAGLLIDRGWSAAVDRCLANGGPKLVYLSYEDAGGTAERSDLRDGIFSTRRGLWFLSGYVISREGASALLRAMPVTGPVDMWMNRQFEALGALALSTPAISQRRDAGSDNSYSILPYLARAGVVDASSTSALPPGIGAAKVVAWTNARDEESLAMALSMLGLRVLVFDGDEDEVEEEEFARILEIFDAVIDPPLAECARSAVMLRADVQFIIEGPKFLTLAPKMARNLPATRTLSVADEQVAGAQWSSLCAFLGLDQPVQAYPLGANRSLRIFRDDRRPNGGETAAVPLQENDLEHDSSPWVLPRKSRWRPVTRGPHSGGCARGALVHASMESEHCSLRVLSETFPGNLASFDGEGVSQDEQGVHLTIARAGSAPKPYRSGALASVRAYQHGRFEAEIKAAAGSGLLTGFFLHRDSPRQEIDIELAGRDPTRMLINVYFNPGDDGATMAFGYRGSPCRIDLGFDATLDFHHYGIEWRPGYISWSVDRKIVHERGGWDPTPLPHLPMFLHFNLWAPRSEELAGKIIDRSLPSSARFRNVSIRG